MSSLSRKLLGIAMLTGCIHALSVPASPVLARDDNTIILRLDDTQPQAPRKAPEQAPPAPKQEQPEEQPATTSEPVAPVINVPPRCVRLMPPPTVKAASVVLMDAETGQVIYAKNPHVKRPNASTTKIVTAILLIEHCQMTDKIKASKKACETQFTSIHLKPGEQITAQDLLMGLMVRSANDAAVAAAEHIAGSTAKFSALMNKKVQEIGCSNTHFVTPNGLYCKGHYSTAYDLCLMARYGFRYSEFNQAACTRKYFLESRTINKKDLAVISHSKFLRDYAGADGVKSGYIKQAGYCLVGSATRGGWRLLSAVLKSDNAGRDTAAIMNYAFANYEPYIVAKANSSCTGAQVKGGSQATVAAAPVCDVRVIVPKTGARVTTSIELIPLEAPIEKGATLGKMIASVNGKPVTAVELRAAEDVGVSVARRAWWWTKTCGMLCAGFMVWRRYGRTPAKGPRRRRRRVTAALRSFDRYR